MRAAPYEKLIRASMSRQHCDDGFDPRHIEGYMRLEHSTLDGLSMGEFDREVAIGIACILEDGVHNAERNAQSFGM